MPARFFRSKNYKTKCHKKYHKKKSVKYQGDFNNFPIPKNHPKNS